MKINVNILNELEACEEGKAGENFCIFAGVSVSKKMWHEHGVFVKNES